MLKNLRLGLFNFRNDDVLLMTGDKSAVETLGRHLQSEFSSGSSCVAIHDIAQVSDRHNALLFAVRKGAQPPTVKNAFFWQCSNSDIAKLIEVRSGPSQLYFDLTKTPPFFYVNFSGHYDAVWWSTYG